MSESNNNMPWSIRGITPNTKSFAVSSAKKAGLNVGEWIELAILEKIKNDRNGGRSLANKPEGIDPTSVDNFLTMMQKMNSAGVPVSKRLASNATSMMNRIADSVKKGKVLEISSDSQRSHQIASNSVERKQDTNVNHTNPDITQNFDFDNMEVLKDDEISDDVE